MNRTHVLSRNGRTLSIYIKLIVCVCPHTIVYYRHLSLTRNEYFYILNIYVIFDSIKKILLPKWSNLIYQIKDVVMLLIKTDQISIPTTNVDKNMMFISTYFLFFVLVSSKSNLMFVKQIYFLSIKGFSFSYTNSNLLLTQMFLIFFNRVF